jgi:hypothetical protein
MEPTVGQVKQHKECAGGVRPPTFRSCCNNPRLSTLAPNGWPGLSISLLSLAKFLLTSRQWKSSLRRKALRERFKATALRPRTSRQSVFPHIPRSRSPIPSPALPFHLPTQGNSVAWSVEAAGSVYSEPDSPKLPDARSWIAEAITGHRVIDPKAAVGRLPVHLVPSDAIRSVVGLCVTHRWRRVDDL